MATMEPRKPAKRPSNASEARRTNVLLEEIRAQFKAFGEGLTSVSKRLDRLAKDVESLGDWARKFSLELQALRTDVNELKKDMKDIKERLATVEAR
jgi:chromosome segregation ATPase